MMTLLATAPASTAISALLAEIDDLRSQIVALQRLADTDCLTKLANRRILDAELRRAIQMAARHGTRATLALLDVDGLKSINDRFGHVAGDAVLGHVARCLKSAFRQTDVVGRLAGDEFMLILHHAGPEEAVERIVQFADELAANPAQTEKGAVTTRLSWGVTEIDGADTPALAIGRADAAMYGAKRAQRSER